MVKLLYMWQCTHTIITNGRTLLFKEIYWFYHKQGINYCTVMFVWMCQQAIAFRDVNPVAPTHVLVIPRKPITQLAASTEEDIPVSTKSLYYPSCRVGLKYSG